MSPSLRYGAYLGLTQIAATLLVFAFGLHSTLERLESAGFVESLLRFIFLMGVIALAHRASHAARPASAPAPGIGKSIRSAALLALVGALLTGLLQACYVAFINPALRDLERQQIIAKASEHLSRLSPEDHAAALRHIDTFTSPANRGFIYGINTLLFATLLGIAFALIFRAAARRDQASLNRA